MHIYSCLWRNKNSILASCDICIIRILMSTLGLWWYFGFQQVPHKGKVPHHCTLLTKRFWHKPWTNFMVECYRHTHANTSVVADGNMGIYISRSWTERLKESLERLEVFHLDTTHSTQRLLAVCQSVAADSAALECNCFWWCWFWLFALFGSLHIFENGGSPADLKESKTEQLLLSENMQMETVEFINAFFILYLFLHFIHISSVQTYWSHVLQQQYSSFKFLKKFVIKIYFYLLKHLLPCKCSWLFPHLIALKFSFSDVVHKCRQTGKSIQIRVR